MEYSISDDIKRDLGYIIKQIRELKYLEVRNEKIVDKNPYTKENFCDNNKICHYHTLTKLENDIAKEDNLYHIFLEKLGYTFQVESDEHEKNMESIFNLSTLIFRTVEYLDINLVEEIKNEIKELGFESDCIAKIYLNLLIFTFEVITYKSSTITHNEIERFVDLYKGVFRALANHSLGIYYINHYDQNKAIKYFIEATTHYEAGQVSRGLSHFPLFKAYTIQKIYLKSVDLALELETYYEKTNNNNRLIFIYIFLSDYYLMINSYDYAKKYYDKSENLANIIAGISIHMLYYNWGYRKMINYKFEKALNYFLKAHNTCQNPHNKLLIINRLLIIYTILNDKSEDINKLRLSGEAFQEQANILEQYIYKYFVYKSDKTRYYRKFAVDKIIPILKEDINIKVLLLFFYEDLYDK